MSRYELLESLNPIPETRGDPGPLPAPAPADQDRSPRVRLLAVAAGLFLLVGLSAYGLRDRQPVQIQVGNDDVAEQSVAPTAAATKPSPEPIAQTPSQPDVAPSFLLPDPQRWVVVEDWAADPRGEEPADPATIDGVQLNVAPLDEDGVPQLGRQISLNYRLASVSEFDPAWDANEASAVGEPIDFTFGINGVGRSVNFTQGPTSIGVTQVWANGTLVSIQTVDQLPESDLVELAKSMTAVSAETWVAARTGTADQRLIAIEAAMKGQVATPIAAPDERLPRWVLPSDWELQWVTDLTIWTPEQHAQRDAFAQAVRSPTETFSEPIGSGTWHFGFGDTAESAASQFVPQFTIGVSVYDEPPPVFHPSNYPTIEALGLDGVIANLNVSSASVDLGVDELRVSVYTSGIGPADTRKFLDAIDFATSDPLDGFASSDDRYQPIDLPQLDQPTFRWLAAWQHPDGREAFVSVERLNIARLRWVLQRGYGTVQQPENVWEIVASEGTIDLGQGATYDVATGLTTTVRGVTADELIPIELDDWITLVEPHNADPINPR